MECDAMRCMAVCYSLCLGIRQQGSRKGFVAEITYWISVANNQNQSCVRATRERLVITVARIMKRDAGTDEIEVTERMCSKSIVVRNYTRWKELKKTARDSIVYMEITHDGAQCVRSIMWRQEDDIDVPSVPSPTVSRQRPQTFADPFMTTREHSKWHSPQSFGKGRPLHLSDRVTKRRRSDAV